jgi:hypothetical protein
MTLSDKIFRFIAVLIVVALSFGGVFFIDGLLTGDWPTKHDPSITFNLIGSQVYTYHSVGTIVINPHFTVEGSDKPGVPAIQYSDKYWSTDKEHPENDSTTLLVSDSEKVFIPRRNYVLTDSKGKSFYSNGPLVITPNDVINGRTAPTIRFQEKGKNPNYAAVFILRGKAFVEVAK